MHMNIMRTRIRPVAAALILALSVPLAGCSILGPGGVNSTPAPFVNTSVDEKALYVAETAFKGASLAIEQAVDSGLLKGERAAQVAVHYETAYTVLLVARDAQKAGNAESLLTSAIEVQTLVTKIFGLIRKPD